MLEREVQAPAIFDPIPRYLSEISAMLSSRQERMPLVAEQMKLISLNPELSQLVEGVAKDIVSRRQRVNEYLESVAVMHRILQDHTVGGFPILSSGTKDRVRSRDLSTIQYEDDFPNLMMWVGKESSTSTSQIPARQGFMTTFALAYTELHPPKPSFFRRIRR